MSFPSVSRQVDDSLVLRAVDKVMPHQVLYLPVFPPLAGLLNAGGIYSPIFSAIGAEGGLDLPGGQQSVLHTRAVPASSTAASSRSRVSRRRAR